MTEGPGDASNFPDYTDSPDLEAVTTGTPVAVTFEGF
jgi:hypothetical protein